jgi:hypothetical protein
MHNLVSKSGPRGLVVLLAASLTLGGCAVGRWFENDHPNSTQSSDTSSADPKGPSVAYLRSLCRLPREQRQAQVRALNEALLPDHVVVSCGRSGLEQGQSEPD